MIARTSEAGKWEWDSGESIRESDYFWTDTKWDAWQTDKCLLLASPRRFDDFGVPVHILWSVSNCLELNYFVCQKRSEKIKYLTRERQSDRYPTSSSCSNLTFETKDSKTIITEKNKVLNCKSMNETWTVLLCCDASLPIDLDRPYVHYISGFGDPEHNHLTPIPEQRIGDEVWYYRSPMGVNSLSKLVKKMCMSKGITGNKTNHSIRKTYVRSLSHDCNPAQQYN